MKRLAKQIIGLTGSIGSGKSAVSGRLAQLGAHVLDADVISRNLLAPDGACFDAVIRRFGTGILRADGTIDRKALADVVFADVDNRRLLNGIVHPEVRRVMREDAHAFASNNPMTPVILDVPLLFECGMERDAQQTLLVYADEAVCLRRIVARDGCTPEHARLRMASQMPQQEKRRLADVVLDNNGTLEMLYRQVDAWYEALLQDTTESEK